MSIWDDGSHSRFINEHQNVLEKAVIFNDVNTLGRIQRVHIRIGVDYFFHLTWDENGSQSPF